MNSNPDSDNSRKQNQMNAITKATCVAVLVALGLSLGTVAAEGPATPAAETGNTKPDWSKFDRARLNAQALAEYARQVRPGILV